MCRYTTPKLWKGPWCSITNTDEIGYYICKENTKQYNQAQHTPFGSGYLADTLRDTTTSSGAQQKLSIMVHCQGTQPLLQENIGIIKFPGYHAKIGSHTGQIFLAIMLDTLKLS
jgi:hypothetical protein